MMLQVMNLVMKSESCLSDWKRSLLVPLTRIVTVRKQEIIRELP